MPNGNNLTFEELILHMKIEQPTKKHFQGDFFPPCLSLFTIPWQQRKVLARAEI